MIADGMVIEPRDHLNATAVLTADEASLLTWDLSAAEVATPANVSPTFIARFVAIRPFCELPPGLNTEFTRASQMFVANQQGGIALRGGGITRTLSSRAPEGACEGR